MIDRGWDGGCSERVGNEVGNWGWSWGIIGSDRGEAALEVSVEGVDGPGYSMDGGNRDFDNWKGDLGDGCEFDGDDLNISDEGETDLVNECIEMLLLLSHFLSLGNVSKLIEYKNSLVISIYFANSGMIHIYLFIFYEFIEWLWFLLFNY